MPRGRLYNCLFKPYHQHRVSITQYAIRYMFHIFNNQGNRRSGAGSVRFFTSNIFSIIITRVELVWRSGNVKDFHATVRGSVPGGNGVKKTQLHVLRKEQYMGMPSLIPYLHLAWPGLRQNCPRQFGHGRASLPIYTGSANHALLANYPIYI